MGFNYKSERNKFEKEWTAKVRGYRDAGMCCAQINAMRDFEEEMFRNRRTERIHIQYELPSNFWELLEAPSAEEQYFNDLWQTIDLMLDNISPGLSKRITEVERKIMLLLYLGLSQEEISRKIQIGQSSISYHLKKIRRIFKNLR